MFSITLDNLGGSGGSGGSQKEGSGWDHSWMD